MRAFGKRKPEPAPEPILAPAPAPAPDLAGEILKLRGQVEAFIEARVQELKASESGRSLPVEVLRETLTHGSGCLCAVAMAILSEQSR